MASNRWKTTQCGQGAANADYRRPIHPQGKNRCSAFRRLTDESPRSCHVEMLRPAVTPRMEQGNELSGLRVACLPPSGLPQRTGYTSQRQIAGGRCTAGRLRVDMIDMKCRLLRNLRQSAVFADVAGTSAHRSRQGCRNVAAHDARRLFASSARSRISDRMSTNSASAAASRRSRAESRPCSSCRSSNS